MFVADEHHHETNDADDEIKETDEKRAAIRNPYSWQMYKKAYSRNPYSWMNAIDKRRGPMNPYSWMADDDSLNKKKRAPRNPYSWMSHDDDKRRGGPSRNPYSWMASDE